MLMTLKKITRVHCFFFRAPLETLDPLVLLAHQGLASTCLPLLVCLNMRRVQIL